MILRDFFFFNFNCFSKSLHFIQILQQNYLNKENLELFEQLFIDKFFNLLKCIIECINELNLDIF